MQYWPVVVPVPVLRRVVVAAGPAVVDGPPWLLAVVGDSGLDVVQQQPPQPDVVGAGGAAVVVVEDGSSPSCSCW